MSSASPAFAPPPESFVRQAGSGQHLPFATPASASVAGRKLSESKHQRRAAEPPLREGAPNVLIVMLDDAGFAHPDSFGGEINTPTLTRLAQTGISYNAFHNCGVCSPTRASLLTGRNAHRVGYGHIAEYASDWDGYVGTIPKSAGTIAEVLQAWGYSTAAFGKWHNTSPLSSTQMGPFDRWPTGHGFEHFYGFLGGETSQFDPRLVLNTAFVEPPQKDDYHLTEDMAEKAIDWLRAHEALRADKPFMMYWAPGAVHGPHHVLSKWSDKYKGRFDEGWDAYRERVFQRQKSMGWIPESAELTPRPDTLASWDSIPPEERAFQTRLMEVYAGFLEHTDAQLGKVIDELERLGVRDNTLVFFVFSDNGGSAEGQNGTISELLAQNRVKTDISEHLAVLDSVGGSQALGGPKTWPMYHAGWAWAGSTPFQSTKLIAAHFGGTRTPLVVSWPKGIKPDTTPRPQFHHVNDIAPTIYDILGIQAPLSIHGVHQDSLDGISMRYTFGDAAAQGRKGAQYFEVGGSRMIHHDGWTAGVFGPRVPWRTVNPGIAQWDPDRDVWELYCLDEDYSQANDLAHRETEKLVQLKEIFSIQAGINQVYPIGALRWIQQHPKDRITPTTTQWHFPGRVARIPEYAAPNVRARSYHATIEIDGDADTSGVLYALGGFSGGTCLYIDQGCLAFEYNMLGLRRYQARSPRLTLPPGQHRIEVQFEMAPGDAQSRPATASLSVNGKKVASVSVAETVAENFSYSETFDVGCDLGSPVASEYFDRAPFAFTGVIRDLRIRYTDEAGEPS